MSEAAPEVSTPEAPAHRVFVGNLSYDTDSDALRAHFAAQDGAEVTDAIVVRKFNRPAGFGFVTFATAEAAERAVALKESELGGRSINVELAVAREAGDAPRSTRGTRGGRGGRGRGRSTRGRGGRRQPLPEGHEPSRTTLFVGNLPFNVIDQDLVNIFEKFPVVRAHVVRLFNGASRGFGFVTFATEEEQATALASLGEVLCDGRKLIIRPAISDEAYKSKPREIVVKTAADA